MPNYASEFKKIAKDTKKKEKFLRTRMWFSTLQSFLFNDAGVIPENIGNNIQIGNNMYITKNSLNIILRVNLSEETPVAFTSKLLKTVKSHNIDAGVTKDAVSIDFTIKNARQYYDLNSSGLDRRVDNWEHTLEVPMISKKQKRRTSRLLYSVGIAKSGMPLFRSHIYITLRAATGKCLREGLASVEEYLQGIDADYKIIKSDVNTHLEYMALSSDKRPQKVKDIPSNIMSAQTLAEILPTSQGINDVHGPMLGIDKEVNNPYNIDFRAVTAAKNIYVGGLSGFGKTFLVQNWALEFYIDHYRQVFRDIKGTEFTALTKALGGVVISLRATSTKYINYFRLNPREIHSGETPRVFADKRFNDAKHQILTICKFKDDVAAEGEALIEQFLHAMYRDLGVLNDNQNTWERTDLLTPYVVFEHFEKYLSVDICRRYERVAVQALQRLRIYYSREGSNSHMFRDPYSYEDILDKEVISFDFGMAKGNDTQDDVMFKIHFDMSTAICSEYVYHNFERGIYTVVVDEETEVASDYCLEAYTKDVAIMRAQKQITILLGNSITTLASNPKAKTIMDLINVLCIGVMHRTSREYLVNEYGLDNYSTVLENLDRDPEMANTFLLINKMQKKSTTAMLKVYVPSGIARGQLFSAVTDDDF